MVLSNIKYNSLLFLTQLIWVAIVSTHYFDSFARLILRPSSDPQGAMIGFGGIFIVAIPYLISIILLAILFTYLIVNLFAKSNTTLVCTITISALIGLSFQFGLSPYFRSKNLLKARMRLLSRDLRTVNHSTSMGLKAISKFKFPSKTWFIETLINDEDISTEMKIAFPDFPNVAIEVNSAFSLLPSKFFDPYRVRGQSLYKSMGNSFDSFLEVKNEKVRISSPKDNLSPFLKISNSVILNSNTIGLNLKIENTNTRILLFVSGNLAYEKALSNEPTGPFLAKPESLKPIISKDF